MSTRSYEIAKRVFDFTAAAFTLLSIAPTLLAVGLLIILDSGRPALFKQVRSGKDGRRFVIYKFRTMIPDHELIDLPVTESHPGVTRIGRMLRATSVDELPQLINVLKGDMSLVGPRPTIPEQVAEYDAHQRRRLEVRPGITGWAQVNGRNTLSWDERIEHDIWYVDNRSMSLDLKIILKTVEVLAQPALTWSPDEAEEPGPPA